MQAILKTTLFLITIVSLWSCNQKPHDHQGHDHTASAPVEEDGNQALYTEVMEVHDEVMPKMDDIYKLKETLKNKLATPGLPEEKKTEIESAIAKLDSASDGMMVWMRQFNPIPDSVDKQKAREYLENEMVKVKKVREDILEAITKGTETSKTPTP